MSESASHLWPEFNLGANDPSPGKGILTCLRCTPEEIRERHPSVIAAIQTMGIDLQDIGEEGIAVVVSRELSESERTEALDLLAQLSSDNEALEFHAKGYGVARSIAELTNGLMMQYFELLEHKKLPDAYDLVTVIIPEIVRDIETTHAREQVLCPTEEEEIRKLVNFAVSQEKNLNKPTVLLSMGRSSFR